MPRAPLVAIGMPSLLPCLPLLPTLPRVSLVMGAHPLPPPSRPLPHTSERACNSVIGQYGLWGTRVLDVLQKKVPQARIFHEDSSTAVHGHAGHAHGQHRRSQKGKKERKGKGKKNKNKTRQSSQKMASKPGQSQATRRVGLCKEGRYNPHANTTPVTKTGRALGHVQCKRASLSIWGSTNNRETVKKVENGLPKKYSSKTPKVRTHRQKGRS